MTKRIFRSIFAAALTVLLAAMVLIMGAVYDYFTQVQFEQLRVETALASHAVANEGFAYFEQLDDTMDCRITWIGADGIVLYDNRGDTETMVNHLEREEVREALDSGYGQSSRYSDTLLERYIYAAELLPDGTILRLSVGQDSMLHLILDLSGSIAGIIGAAVLLSYVLARRLSRGIVRPLNRLDLDAPTPEKGYEELTPLLRRLVSQQEQLQTQSRQLRQRQKEFDTVTRSLSEGLVLLSGSGTVLSINPAAARLLEVTPNCIGADFSVANRNAAIAALTESAFAGKKSEQVVRLPEGEFQASASPVKSGGELSGVVVLLFDVTQKRQAELLRREFTANVSHELKTPLHAISGYAELMKSGIVPQTDIPAFSEKIYAEAQRMARLVEDTLRLSRLEEGETDLQWAVVDLLEEARLVAAALAAPAELSQVTLFLDGGPTMLRTVPQLLGAILSNLVDNAIKYNRPGGQVRIRVEQTAGETRLTISDTGIGIPEDQQERIFERFYRVDKSRSKAVGGTGLGLSIVKHASQILGAGIRLDSVPGRGTTVTVCFPGKETVPNSGG